MTADTPTTKELFSRYVIPTYARFDLCISRGEGCRVWDEDGREYLDFGAGIAVCAIGHAHPRYVEAISRQAARLAHTSNLYFSREQGLLAKRLTGCVGRPGKCFFSNSGAEANEGLFKLARRFGNLTAPGGRFRVITFEGSFHGRTLAGIAATGQDKVKKGFEPMVDGFDTVPFNDADAVERAVGPATAAVLVEPIQGEGGIRFADGGFLRRLRSLCDERGLLLLFDEVQCGLGRTGDWCGWRGLAPEGAEPDAVSWAKGIAGGFPIGAFWVADKEVTPADGAATLLSDLLGPGTHGTTYGGNPLGCVVASTVLDVIEDEGLRANAAGLGAHAVGALRAIGSPLIKEVRGLGLMIGIEFQPALGEALGVGADGAAAIALVSRLHAGGLLSVPAGMRVVRWLPPLNVTAGDIDQAVAILKSTLEELS